MRHGALFNVTEYARYASQRYGSERMQRLGRKMRFSRSSKTKCGEGVGRQRPREEISLNLVTTVTPQQCQLLMILDAFCDHLKPQVCAILSFAFGKRRR
jgi:hypothetical protein